MASSFSQSSSQMVTIVDEVIPSQQRRSRRLLKMSLPEQQLSNDDDQILLRTRSKRTKSTTAKAKKASPARATKARGRPKAAPVTPEKEEDSGSVESSNKTSKAKKGKKKSSPTKKVSPVKRKSPAKKKIVATTKAAPKKKASPKKQKAPVTRNPPKDWESIYSLVEELRQDRSAPVDSDGSEALPQGKEVNPAMYRYQVLITLMLSSQTKDAIVGETIRILQEYGLTVEKISQTSPEVLDKMIYKVGFHNNKTKYILQATKILIDRYNGDIPPTAEAMIKDLPGVGPKMAYIIENVAWNKCTGIGIDTHMHRMFNQLGWVNSKTPEQTRLQLESWLPREHWPTVNLLWVGFGQEVQQFKAKLLDKALDCSRPQEALRLVKKLGLDYRKEAQKDGALNAKLQKVLKNTTN